MGNATSGMGNASTGTDSVSAEVLSATTETGTVSAGMLGTSVEMHIASAETNCALAAICFPWREMGCDCRDYTVKAEAGNKLGEEGPV